MPENPSWRRRTVGACATVRACRGAAGGDRDCDATQCPEHRKTSNRGAHATVSLSKSTVVHHSKVSPPMTEMGQQHALTPRGRLFRLTQISGPNVKLNGQPGSAKTGLMHRNDITASFEHYVRAE